MSTEGPEVSSAKRLGESAALKAERDELKIEFEAEQKQHRGGRGRRVLAAVLVLLSCLTFTIAVPAVWTRRTLSNTDRYVDTVAPIIEHASVTDALSEKISAEIITLIDAKSLAASALPPRALALAPPVADAVEGFVEDRVDEVVASDRFAEFWANANRFIHRQIQAVLRGDGETLTTHDGQIVLNLIPVINEVLARIESRGGDLLGRDVSLPEISDAEVPEAARQKLEAALGVPIPADWGQVVIYEADKLLAVRNAAQTFHRAVFLVVALVLLLAAAVLVVSRTRRWTLLQLSTGMLVGLVVVRRAAMYAQDAIVDLAKPENRDAVRAIVDDLMRGLFSLTQSVMIFLLLVIGTALITGPYSWAVSLRSRYGALLSAIVQPDKEASRENASVAWVLSHRDALRFGGFIAATLLLLVVDLSWVAFFVVVGLVVLYELALARFAGGH